MTEIVFSCLDVRLHLELNLGHTSGVFKSLESCTENHEMYTLVFWKAVRFKRMRKYLTGIAYFVDKSLLLFLDRGSFSSGITWSNKIDLSVSDHAMEVTWGIDSLSSSKREVRPWFPVNLVLSESMWSPLVLSNSWKRRGKKDRKNTQNNSTGTLFQNLRQNSD